MQPKPTTEPRSDYQLFTLDSKGKIEKIGERMAKKLEAIPLPNLKGKTVLDVGCDFGFWSFLASNNGASYVLGIDRNREVRELGQFDLIENNRRVASEYRLNCNFEHINLGKQWKEFGNFDVVFMFSLYHHIFENVGEHLPIWFWLWRNTSPDGMVLWENPTDCKDVVSDRHITGEKRDRYTKENILKAAEQYFTVEHIGPAKHEPHREVYKFTRKQLEPKRINGILMHGAGGASKAFQYDNNRRMKELHEITGFWPQAGSLNLALTEPFDWEKNYYRAQVLDVKDRSKGLDSDWGMRWLRLYPVSVGGIEGYAFKFEGEKYPSTFIEVVSPFRFRDFLKSDMAVVQC